MAVIDTLIEKDKTVYKGVKVKITEDLEKKIKFICEVTGVKEEEYLGLILDSSEINKVYKDLKKKKNDAAVEQSTSTTTSKQNTDIGYENN